MAIVRRLTHEVLDKHTRHTETECTYSVVVEKEGKYLQIDTYGSATRKMHGKKSQSIRFGAEAISQLKEVLAEHF